MIYNIYIYIVCVHGVINQLIIVGSIPHFSLPKTIYDTNQLRKWCHMVPTHGTSVKVCDGSPNFFWLVVYLPL